MTVREAVREAQRRLAALDAAYRKATSRLERATTHRAEVAAEEDRKVAAATSAVEAAVAAMAEAVGVELTAGLCAMDPAEVRRYAKTSEQARPTPAGRRPRPDGPGRARQAATEPADGSLAPEL